MKFQNEFSYAGRKQGMILMTFVSLILPNIIVSKLYTSFLSKIQIVWQKAQKLNTNVNWLQENVPLNKMQEIHIIFFACH